MVLGGCGGKRCGRDEDWCWRGSSQSDVTVIEQLSEVRTMAASPTLLCKNGLVEQQIFRKALLS